MRPLTAGQPEQQAPQLAEHWRPCSHATMHAFARCSATLIFGLGTLPLQVTVTSSLPNLPGLFRPQAAPCHPTTSQR